MSRDATAELRIRFEDEGEAEAVLRGLKADDDNYVTTRREGAVVVVACRAEDVAGLRRAVDDVLATLGVSEDVLDAGGFGD